MQSGFKSKIFFYYSLMVKQAEHLHQASLPKHLAFKSASHG